MPSRPFLTLAAAALLLAGCNKPAPTPEAAVPDTGAVDTVAAAGAPIADSAAAVMDSVAPNNDSVTVIPTDSVADTTLNN
jgi:PBP1b-binding outer membrane lipoprotein LpoB